MGGIVVTVNGIYPLQVGPNANGIQDGWGIANNVTLTLDGGRVNYLFGDGHVQPFIYNDPEIYGSGTEGVPKGFWTVDAGD